MTRPLYSSRSGADHRARDHSHPGPCRRRSTNWTQLQIRTDGLGPLSHRRTDRYRQTVRYIQTQTDSYRYRHTDTDRQIQTDIQIETQTETHTDRHTDRQTAVDGPDQLSEARRGLRSAAAIDQWRPVTDADPPECRHTAGMSPVTGAAARKTRLLSLRAESGQPLTHGVTERSR